MAPVQLYDLPISHFCVKARRILDYKGVKYEIVNAPYHDRRELLAVSGQDYVPYLLYEDEGITWDGIPDFLEAQHPEPTIYPDGTKHVAKIVEHWAHNVVEEHAWRASAPDARKTFTDPHEAWVFEEIQRRVRGDLDEYAKRKPQFLADLVRLLQPVEARLAESPYVLGAKPSLADFALYGALTPLPYTGNEVPRELPHVRKWFATVGALGAK